ncbi:MAG: DNA primase [Pseudomonadota bacterium]
MSLPPGFLDELRNRLSISDVVGRKVMWDPKKSNAAKGDHWAPCPFHHEKTASFHVDDRKGYYYCFGCHAKGDAINFVRETENVGFMEAVEILAGEAGMQMPARDPKAQEKIDRNKQLAEVMEQAVRFYRLQLRSNGGVAARTYLNETRKIKPEIQDRFEIGFAPPGWQNLYDYLTEKGIDTALIIEAGLAKSSDKGRKPYDTFRDRIMFPIRDARGRCIGFGGRAMDPNDGAKYLNSPETALFDKGRALYNHGPAREASGKTGTVIVTEGYMDVIALAQAGFDHAVAPLGTAVTEDQLALAWRMSDEPVFALDGDTAGIRAAMRVIDLAMPLLEAGKGLRFVILPEGKDPDDIIKSGGSEAMEHILGKAEPMVNLLWRRETQGQFFDSPERKAALDARLREAILKIKDKSLRSHYGAAIAELRRGLFFSARPSNGQRQPGSYGQRQPQATDAARASDLARSAPDHLLIESTILLAAILHPDAARTVEDLLERCPIETDSLRPIHQALLNKLGQAQSSSTLIEDLTATLSFDPTEQLRKPPRIKAHPYLRDDSDPELTALTLSEAINRHAAEMGRRREINDALEDITGQADERLTKRIKSVVSDHETALRSRVIPFEDRETAQNGPSVMDQILASEGWKKKKD